ncbi:MAG TPA: response regulator transcription factor [bacterium]|nr:response regulator transcription factor [bacterium]
MKVLIIEDDPAALSVARDLLESIKFEVDTAVNGTEGREKIESNPPDLIVLDLSLPDDFGLDICKDVKAAHPGILIFILTALGNSRDIVAGLEAGADDYLPKPFNQREFIARVQMMIKRAARK